MLRCILHCATRLASFAALFNPRFLALPRQCCNVLYCPAPIYLRAAASPGQLHAKRSDCWVPSNSPVHIYACRMFGSNCLTSRLMSPRELRAKFSTARCTLCLATSARQRYARTETPLVLDVVAWRAYTAPLCGLSRIIGIFSAECLYTVYCSSIL